MLAMGAPESGGAGVFRAAGFLVRFEDSHMKHPGTLDFSRAPGTQLHGRHRPRVSRAQHQVQTRPDSCPLALGAHGGADRQAGACPAPGSGPARRTSRAHLPTSVWPHGLPRSTCCAGPLGSLAGGRALDPPMAQV